MRRVILVLSLALAGAIAVPGAALAAGDGGVGGPAFYVDGELYRTVGTPTDLSGTGAPADSFDVIYQLRTPSPSTWQKPPQATPTTTAGGGRSTC